jgi:pilus assembly protein Flp/PilA
MSMLKKEVHAGQKGQGLAEYALILVLVAMVVIVVLSVLGPAIADVLAQVTMFLNGGIAVVNVELVDAGAFDNLHVIVMTSEQSTVTLTTSEGPGGSASCQPTQRCEITASGVSGGSFTVSTDSGAETSGTY